MGLIYYYIQLLRNTDSEVLGIALILLLYNVELRMISISDIDVDNANIFITLLGYVQIICVLPLFPTGRNF